MSTETEIRLTESDMREYFSECGLSYSEHVNKPNLSVLHSLINIEMIKSKCLQGSFRMEPKMQYKRTKKRGLEFAGLTCEAFYFGGREAVSFNGDGFIGLAGWSDKINVQPILRGFKQWCDWLKGDYQI